MSRRARCGIVLCWALFVLPALAQEPPEPIDAEGRVRLRLEIRKPAGPHRAVPSFVLIVNNDTDRTARVPRSYFGGILLDGQLYRFRRRPYLGDGGDEIAYAPRSEKTHGQIVLNQNWARIVEQEPNRERLAIPLEVLPGEHVISFRLGGKSTNEIRFIVEAEP